MDLVDVEYIIFEIQVFPTLFDTACELHKKLNNNNYNLIKCMSHP